jgi:hypothetical protein
MLHSEVDGDRLSRQEIASNLKVPAHRLLDRRVDEARVGDDLGQLVGVLEQRQQRQRDQVAGGLQTAARSAPTTRRSGLTSAR